MTAHKALLSGLKVLDVGTFIFGPAAATVMSDFGADVIKVEAPGIGDPHRYLSMMPPLPSCEHNYCWLLTSRNKKSVALDLKKEAGREVLLKLVAEADVFVTNFPPAVLGRLRLTYDDLKPLNSRLIYAQASGYGELGDEADKPGYDATAWWARSGLMDVVRQADMEPGISVPGMGDHPSALALYGAIMMALYERERSGHGSKVSSSLVANGIWSNSVYVQSSLCGGSTFERVGRKRSPNALTNLYECSDGRWLFLVMVQEDKDWERFAACIGRPELISDERFAEKTQRRRNASVLIEILGDVFATRSYEEWRALLDASGITFGAITRIDELPDDPQLNDNGVFEVIDGEHSEGMRTISSPIWVEGYDKTTPGPAPALGEHTVEVLSGLGYDSRAIEALRERGAIA